METIRLSCSGALVGPLRLPAFALSPGDCICLCLPGAQRTAEEQALVQALTGARPVPGIRQVKGIRWVERLQSRSGFFRRPTVADWLRQAGFSDPDTAETVDRLQLKPTMELGKLGGDLRLLIALEAACHGGTAAILFSTAGLSPLGLVMVAQTVQSRVDACPALVLAYPAWHGGQLNHRVLPSSRSLELSRATPDAAPQPTRT